MPDVKDRKFDAVWNVPAHWHRVDVHETGHAGNEAPVLIPQSPRPAASPCLQVIRRHAMGSSHVPCRSRSKSTHVLVQEQENEMETGHCHHPSEYRKKNPESKSRFHSVFRNGSCVYGLLEGRILSIHPFFCYKAVFSPEPARFLSLQKKRRTGRSRRPSLSGICEQRQTLPRRCPPDFPSLPGDERFRRNCRDRTVLP